MALELFANNCASTLSAAISTTTATTLSVTSATGFPSGGNFRVLVDSEIMLVTGVSGTTFTVSRGQEGTTAATHSSGAAITQIVTNGGLGQFRSDLYVADTYANIPTAGVAGRLFRSTDGYRVWRDNGSSWEPFSFPGPLHTAPPSSGWSWDNQNGAVLTSNDGTESVVLTSNAGNFTVRLRTIASAPYTYTACVLATMPHDNSGYVGMCVRNSTSGNYVMLYSGQVSGWSGWSVEKWTSATVQGAAYGGSYPNKHSVTIPWFRISDDNTNRKYQLSYDGVNWVTAQSTSRTDYITPDQVGFVVCNTSSVWPTVGTLVSWKQT